MANICGHLTSTPICTCLTSCSCKNIKGITKVRQWFWASRDGMQSAYPFIPKVFSGAGVRHLCRPFEFFLTYLGTSCFHGAYFEGVWMFGFFNISKGKIQYYSVQGHCRQIRVSNFPSFEEDTHVPHMSRSGVCLISDCHTRPIHQSLECQSENNAPV